MSTESLHVQAGLPLSPEALFDAWIDGDRHAMMTGAGASSDARVGGAFQAWDGYIEGRHELLDRPRRIVQAWRTGEFPDGAPDSRLELLLLAENGGTRLHLHPSEIPAGQAERYRQGWEDYYLAPIRAWLAEES